VFQIYWEFHDHIEKKQAGQNLKVNYQHGSGNETCLDSLTSTIKLKNVSPSVTQAEE
jgi:hypothetical protein